MPFVRDGIENVRALALPEGVTADGRGVAVSHAALVTWRSRLEGMLYQVYVNGRFAGRTADCRERTLIAATPASFESAVHIEVIAVSPGDADCDFTGELDKPPAGARVKLTLLRSQSLPLAAGLNAYCDAGSGVIDYTEPVSSSPIPVWACRQDKAGFGMARFGEGDFGFESAAAVGFGKGSFGRDLFGLDADVVEWVSPVLPLGRYRFGVKVVDASGLESATSESSPIAAVPPAKPAAGLSRLEFNEPTNELTLAISQ